MATINPYLNFPGNTEEVFNFYKSVFGGEFITVVRFADMGETKAIENGDGNKIMHIALPIKGNILMGTDATGQMAKDLKQGNNFYLSLTADNIEEADTLYNALSAGGNIFMPIGKSMWGSYFGMFHDKFGTAWMVDAPLS